jgi:hypothetical protein
MRRRRILQLPLLAFAFLGLAVAAEAFPAKVVGVTDGDTITVLRDREPVRVRLNGIDAPEKGQAFGARAKQFGPWRFRVHPPGQRILFSGVNSTSTYASDRVTGIVETWDPTFAAWMRSRAKVQMIEELPVERSLAHEVPGGPVTRAPGSGKRGEVRQPHVVMDGESVAPDPREPAAHGAVWIDEHDAERGIVPPIVAGLMPAREDVRLACGRDVSDEDVAVRHNLPPILPDVGLGLGRRRHAPAECQSNQYRP